MAESPPLAPLYRSWSRCLQGLAANGESKALRNALITAWSAPIRYYHTLHHLSECLTLAEQWLPSAQAPAELEMAIWFHDAICDPGADDNEARSATWAVQALHAAGVNPERIAAIEALILATRHDTPPAGADARSLADIDLAILGAPPTRFAQYEAEIRAEYAHISPALFREGRRRVLARFLARDPLYLTAIGRKQFEAQARANLKAALDNPNHPL
jgi:predicted metal-dependent HD superfamily phosphohydrolase